MDANGWMPIESAPKDGTHVLIAGGTFDAHWDEGLEFKGVCIAYWHGDHWHGNEANAHDEWKRHHPTHWQPLPAPPETADGR